MNDLLKQFAEQAAEYAVLNPTDNELQSELDGKVVTIPEAFINKFAELIVGYCASKIEDEADNLGALEWYGLAVEIVDDFDLEITSE